MRLAFFTNIPSIHQVGLGRAFAKRLRRNYALVCWEPVDRERSTLGWNDSFSEDWIIRAWLSKQERNRAIDILHSAQIVVWGYAPENEISSRISENKITFCYTERIFKRGRWRILDPRILVSIYKKFIINNKPNHHLLSVGPYCAQDFKWLHLFRNRMWRWGYFLEVPEIISRRFQLVPVVLWAGRMLDWKRVDLLIYAAAWAKKKNCKFMLRLIGDGPEKNKLQALVKKIKMEDNCEFVAPMPPQQVWHEMEQADIFVLSSDQQEGWGAVVNEAMCRGCCVIGSKAAGSVPWLIKDGENGFVFEGSRPEDLGRILLFCIQNSEQIRRSGEAARATIQSLWSPDIAAERFLSLCDAIEKGRPSPFNDGGPCSPA
ncbi:MAG: glycosyltransferase family 4 protein [Candidatus Aminicenantes bacterium]|nr:glycosyltransferase family 4 protein [Candidatus Aminicenantes bacterium]